MNTKKVLKTVSVITLINIAAKLFGILRESLIANSFGADYRMDAYNMAMLIPLIFYDILGTAILTTMIPMLSQIWTTKNKESMLAFSNNVLNLTFIVSVVIGIIGFCLSTPLIKILGPGLSVKTVLLANGLVRISMLNCILLSVTCIYQAVLQIMEKFVFQSYLGLMLSIPIIAYLLFVPQGDIVGLTIMTTLGYGLQALFLSFDLRRSGYRYRLHIDLSDVWLRKMMVLILPVLVGVSVNQINVIVGRMLASTLPEGSIAALAYASKLYMMVYSVFMSSFVVIIYQKFAMNNASGNQEALKRNFLKGIKYTNLLLFPASCLLMVLSNPIISVLFKRGQFDETAVAPTSIALICYSVGLLSFGVIDLGTRAFFAMNDTKTPMYNAMFNVAVNVTLNLLLISRLGIAAVALSSSLAALASAVLILFRLRRKLILLDLKGILKYNLKILAATAVMGLAVYIINGWVAQVPLSFFWSNMLCLIVAAAAGLAVYLVMTYLFGISELIEIIGMFKGIFRPGRK